MYLIHESTIKTESGVYEVTVYIVNQYIPKKYTYLIDSEYAVRKFETIYRSSKKLHGHALALLNKFKVKEE